ncbi:hypothetical protein Trisim1_000270 [Trichoderma cf. simile WF8]
MVLLDLLTLGLWSKVGRLTHYAFDAVLRKNSLGPLPCVFAMPNVLLNLHVTVSAFLAGVKRSTGLTFKSDKVAGENKDISKWIDKYLGVGEWVMDQSVAIAGSSGFFERKR